MIVKRLWTYNGDFIVNLSKNETFTKNKFILIIIDYENVTYELTGD